DGPIGPSRQADTGTVAHDALRRFAERWRAAEADGEPAPTESDLLAIGRESYWAHAGEASVAPRDTLDQLEALLRTYWRELHDPDAQILEVEHAVKVAYERDGLRHTLDMRLDRLDRIEGGVRLVDYKTGRPKADYTSPKPSDLQMGLYAMAIEQAFPDAAGRAEYWLLASGERGSIELSAIDLVKVRAAIDETIDGVLAGRFARGKRCRGECVALLGGRGLRADEARGEALLAAGGAQPGASPIGTP
ncbi:MAG: PD-(D/E)XK nuclease family protein, partial [Planctomycetota bacterium]